MRINKTERLFFIYSITNKIPTYTYKIFSTLELQVNALALRSRLVPFSFMASELCFYRLFFVNQKLVTDPFYVLGISDTLQIPIFLYRYFFYKHLGLQYLPQVLLKFFKQYWSALSAFQHNKLWTASSFLMSQLEAKVLIFAYPSVLTYIAPFRRFSKLFYKNQAFAYTGRQNFIFYTHSVIKLKLFSYGWFYK